MKRGKALPTGWRDNTNWKTSAPLSAWYGVTPDEDGRVTELSLVDNQLSGTIPPTLGNLSNLTSLVLNRNQLSGTIPAALGNLSNLTSLVLSDLLLQKVFCCNRFISGKRE